MDDVLFEDRVIRQLAGWGKEQPRVRAMLLTSTRAVPGASWDVLSDYDVILVVEQVEPFYATRDWLAAFGPLLALYRDPLTTEEGFLKAGYVVQYEDGLKIDFIIWPTDWLRQTAAADQLPVELDAGYRVLLDKDGLAEGMRPPSYRGYIPAKPSQAEYLENIEVCFVDAGYAAKFLWRDDLVAFKYIMECMIMQEHLRPMLEWHIECEHGWTVKPGPYGRRLKQLLRDDLWAELESAYAGAGLAENWEALEKTLALFRRAAEEVGERLGYAYPEELDRRAHAYLEKVKSLPRGAQRFG